MQLLVFLEGRHTGKLSGGWPPRDAQHTAWHEELRACLGSRLQWLLPSLYFRRRLSTAGLHMERGHVLVSARVCSPTAGDQHCPAVPAVGRTVWLGLPATAAHHRVGGEGWSDRGRLLCRRKPSFFFFNILLSLAEFLASVWGGFFKPCKPHSRKKVLGCMSSLAVCRPVARGRR